MRIFCVFFCKGSVYVDVLTLRIWVVLFRMLLFMSLLVQYKENSIYTHTCEFQGQYCFSCRRGIVWFTALFKLELVRCNFILFLAMMFGIFEC